MRKREQNWLKLHFKLRPLDSLTIEDPETLEQFAAGAFDRQADHVVVRPRSTSNVMGVAKQFSGKATFASIKFIDIDENAIELDPRMRHAIAHANEDESLFQYLPTDYNSYNIFVDAGVILTREDAMILGSWSYAKHILIVLKQQPSESFMKQFQLMTTKGLLRNVHLLQH